jgi:hypothetical protein
VGREIGNPVLKFKNGKFSSELFATLSFVSLSVKLPLSDDVSEPDKSSSFDKLAPLLGAVTSRDEVSCLGVEELD